MVLWKSEHPDLDIPTNLTTWQWAFESKDFSPTIYANKTGYYENAISKERLHYSEVKNKSTQLSTALIRKHGFQPGDTVSLLATNTIWYPIALWATIRGGGRINGASSSYNAEEMAYALNTAKSKFLFTLPGSLDVAVAAAKAVGMPQDHVFLLEGQRHGYTNIQQLIEEGKNIAPDPSYSIPTGKTNKDVCGYLNFSSGTTGHPKAVMLSHHNIIAQCHQLRQLQVIEPEEELRALAVTPLFHITVSQPEVRQATLPRSTRSAFADPRHLLILLSQNQGLVRYIHYPIFMNGNCIMLPSFSMDTMLQTIISYQIRELILVPPIIIRLVRDPIVEQYMPELSRTVKRWSSGSAPISPEIIELLRKKFPATGFRQGYGATESTACITCHPSSHYDYKYAHTGGKLVANTIAKVLSLENPENELGPGAVGEICAKGPQIAMGYLDNLAATRETFDSEGYFHTGDVGFFDSEGLIHIVDRIKEMIKVRGQQVAPAELEDILLGHTTVEDCAVLGIPDDYSGEKPKAFVVLKPGIKPSVDLGMRLLRVVQEKKVRYKWLLEIEFADSIPKSPTGKLLRRILKAEDRVKGRQRGLTVRDAEKAKL